LRTLIDSNCSIKIYAQYLLCVSLFVGFNSIAGEKSVLVVQKLNQSVSDSDIQTEGMNKTLELNFSPENREKLRKALDDYARSVDQDHQQIEARRRAMQESIKARFFDADSDFDNTIDRQEATEKLPQIARHFSAVDENQDGLISLEELEAAQMRILERRRAAEETLELQKSLEAESTLVSKRKSKQAANGARKPSL
jgi:EF hand